MATTDKNTKTSPNTGSTIKKFNNFFTTPSLSIYGKVNIDNISDNDYETIQKITEATFSRQIHWKPQSFMSIITQIVTKKQLEIQYSANFNGMNICLTSNIKGKTTIKVTKGLTKKVIVDTYILANPVLKFGMRAGTSRSLTLYKLFKAVRYQVDGELIAS